MAVIPGAFGPLVAAALVTHLRGESVREWLATPTWTDYPAATRTGTDAAERTEATDA